MPRLGTGTAARMSSREKATAKLRSPNAAISEWIVFGELLLSHFVSASATLVVFILILCIVPYFVELWYCVVIWYNASILS